MNILLENITLPNCQKNWQKPVEFCFKVRYLLPTSTLITQYNALFMSFLQTFDSYIEPLFKLQKRAVRVISHQHFLAHSLPIFTELSFKLLIYSN